MRRGAGLRALDLGALLAALPAAHRAYEWLAVPAAKALAPVHAYWPIAALAALLWGASAWMHGVYGAPYGHSSRMEIGRVLRAFAAVAVVLAAAGFVVREYAVSRLLVALYLGLSLSLLVALRGARRLAARLTAGAGARRYGVVGTGGLAREIVEVVGAHPEWGLRFAGFVRPDGAAGASRGPVLGELSELGEILEREVLDLVIFAVPRDRLGEVERGIHLCEDQGVEVRICLDVLRFGPGRMTVADMGGLSMLAFTRTPSDAVALALKRAFDVAVSALVIVALSPLFAAIALAIRLDSPGPALFRQRRVGRNGRLFDMLKFRSMHLDAEQRLEALRAHNEMSGPVFKMANDPRITRVGRFLRRTSLDELPQFWNVLKGEMSVVGPRPPLPSEVRQYRRWQRRRLSMKPGITCIWQVSGRNAVDFDRWMELDLEYIDGWSLWGDLKICLRTIPAVISSRGAY